MKSEGLLSKKLTEEYYETQERLGGVGILPPEPKEVRELREQNIAACENYLREVRKMKTYIIEYSDDEGRQIRPLEIGLSEWTIDMFVRGLVLDGWEYVGGSKNNPVGWYWKADPTNTKIPAQLGYIVIKVEDADFQLEMLREKAAEDYKEWSRTKQVETALHTCADHPGHPVDELYGGCAICLEEEIDRMGKCPAV